MRLATWNVNSLKARQARVEEWLDYAKPDVLCIQETKLADAAFPAMAFAVLGYEALHHGDGRWNGVAILSRVGIADPVVGLADGAAPVEDEERRFVSATCGGVRISSVYVPNGREVGTVHYDAKLLWLQRLRDHLARACDPTSALAVCGDFNVAPEDRDVYDITQFEGATHVSEPERDAVRSLEAWGLEDAFRRVYPDQAGLFSWWDYRAGNFHKGLGMRIDLVLATRVITSKLTYALIDRNARKGEKPSDHAPVLIDFDL